MPDFDFIEGDLSHKTSHSNIVYLSEVALQRGKREIERRTEDGSKRIS